MLAWNQTQRSIEQNKEMGNKPVHEHVWSISKEESGLCKREKNGLFNQWRKANWTARAKEWIKMDTALHHTEKNRTKLIKNNYGRSETIQSLRGQGEGIKRQRTFMRIISSLAPGAPPLRTARLDPQKKNLLGENMGGGSKLPHTDRSWQWSFLIWHQRHTSNERSGMTK